MLGQEISGMQTDTLDLPSVTIQQIVASMHQQQQNFQVGSSSLDKHFDSSVDFGEHCYARKLQPANTAKDCKSQSVQAEGSNDQEVL